MRKVNVLDCALPYEMRQGAFRFDALDLSEPLESRVAGATVYEVRAGDRLWPYHHHDGFDEWLYVLSGAPVLRDPSGERTLEPGALVGFPSGPAGAHGMRGPGRFLIFSTGARGLGEAFVTVYPDSDKISAAPGVTFRRADAIESWAEEHGESWTATRVRDTGPYRYTYGAEEWLLVLDGSPLLRHPGGEDELRAGDLVCFPEGPDGAHELHGDARAIAFKTPANRPTSTFHPDAGTVAIRVPGGEGHLFRLADRIDDYWDGE